jgi:hypothetical protein
VLSHRWARRLRSRGRLVALAHLLVAAALLLGTAFGAGVGGSLAQDDLESPVADSGQAQTDQSIDEPVEPPADEEIDTSTEFDPPIEEPAGDEQPADGVDEPTDAGTPDETLPPEEPAEDPTPTPTAIPPAPVLVIDQPASVQCELAPEQPESIASGGTQEYDCRAELGLSGSAVDPAQVAIDWQFDAAAPGAWVVQLRENDEHPWPDVAEPPVLAAQTGIDDVVPAEDGAFSTTQTETFELLVTRASCDLAPADIQVQVSASPSLDGAPVGASTLPEPLKLQPALAAIGQPVVAFDGPLNFGSVDADASGPAVSTLSGTLGLTLSGLDATCGNWQIAIGGNGMVDGEGQPLPGSALVVLPTDAGVACDVRDGCPVAQVAGDAAADPTRSLSLDLELRLGDMPVTGTFSTSLTVTITPLDGPNSDGNGE